MKENMCKDYLKKRIISIIYKKGKKDFLSLCFKGFSSLIKKGLVMCGKRRLHKKKRDCKANLNIRNSLIKKANKQK
jgi:hypothetical protein